jgi:hypothetical protein
MKGLLPCPGSWKKGLKDLVTSPNSQLLDGAILFLAFLPALLFATCGSLVTDELGTYITIKDGLWATYEKASSNPQQHPLYYVLLSLWSSVFGFSEVALRLPSIAAAVVAAVFFARSISKIVPDTPIFLFTALLLVSPSYGFIAFLARPYGLGLLFFSLGFYLCVLAVQKTSRTLVLLSAAAMTCAFWCHYSFIFAYILIVALLLGWRLDQARRLGISILAYPLFAGVGFWIVVQDMLSLNQHFDTHRQMAVPSLKDLAIHGFFAVELLWLYLLRIIVQGRVWPPPGIPVISLLRGPARVLTAWWVVGVLSVFCASYVLGTGIFHLRYFIWSVPAVVFCQMSLMLIPILHDSMRRHIVLFGYALLAAYIQFSSLNALELPSWRARSVSLAKFATGAIAPLFLAPGPFVESSHLFWLRSYAGRMRDMFDYYPLSGPVVILPRQLLSEEIWPYVEESISKSIPQADVVFVLPGGSAELYDRLQVLLATMGFTEQAELSDGDTTVLAFRKRMG